ncbi:MAG: M48 family metalloprotease, partial [Chlorobia bacterium]|nr:M48 family metalloprotease [Fimbriimonadaceae bacterium]
FLMWLGGVAVLLFSVATVIPRLLLIAKRGEPASNPSLLSTVEELADRMGLSQVPELRIAKSRFDVFTIGVHRPQIVISPQVIEGCSFDELRLVLAHELAHLRRGDMWVSLVAQIATVLFFFHPIAWLAAREFELARESACDEVAVRTLPARSDMYGQLLVKLSSGFEPSASFLVLGISSHYRALSRRITMLNRLSNSRSADRYRRVAFVACLVGLLLIVPWSLVPANAAPQKQGSPTQNGFVDLGKIHVARFEAVQKDIRKVMADLLDKRGIKYTVDADVQGNITLALTNVNLEVALMNCLKQLSAGYRYHVSTRTFQIVKAKGGPTVTPTTGGGLIPTETRRTDISAHKADIRETMRTLFRTYGNSYSIAPDVQGTVMDVNLKNVTFDEALQEILPKVNATFSVQGGVYMITKVVPPVE